MVEIKGEVSEVRTGLDQVGFILSCEDGEAFSCSAPLSLLDSVRGSIRVIGNCNSCNNTVSHKCPDGSVRLLQLIKVKTIEEV